MKTIYQGAEAKIYKDKNIIKDRTEKSYRHPELDKKIRKLRTRHEKKIIERASKLIPTPRIISSSEENSKIEMTFIKGKKLSENLEKLDHKKVSKEIGKNLAILHDNDIIHGDLTTSNLIWADEKINSQKAKEVTSKQVYFIDFGLSFHSARIEDKAVDLHLIKEALTAKHPTIAETAFKEILKGYKKSKNYQKTINQLEKVEKRGRYKAQH